MRAFLNINFVLFSGKSTIVKMLRLIFKGKLTDQEKKSFISILHNNTLVCMQTLLKACDKFEYKFDDADSVRAAEKLNEYDGKVWCIHNSYFWH